MERKPKPEWNHSFFESKIIKTNDLTNAFPWCMIKPSQTTRTTRPIKCTFGDAMPLSDKNGAQGRGQRKSGCQIDRKYMSFEEEKVKLW
jgi:hypothetical protein